jgi:dipeptide/tripeptide permease
MLRCTQQPARRCTRRNATIITLRGDECVATHSRSVVSFAVSQKSDVSVTSISGRTDEAAFSGHPRGLFYLAFTEAWERFSYYGMMALVVLYMVNELLIPGRVEHIVGFGALRQLIETVTGPLSTQALASQIFGMYAGFVYFTPLLGSFIADRWIGQRSAVVLGGFQIPIP